MRAISFRGVVTALFLFLFSLPSFAALTWSSWTPDDPDANCQAEFNATGASAFGWVYAGVYKSYTTTGQLANCRATCTNQSLCGANYGLTGNTGPHSHARTATCGLGETWNSATGTCGIPNCAETVVQPYAYWGEDSPGYVKVLSYCLATGCRAVWSGTAAAKTVLSLGVPKSYSYGEYRTITGSTCPVVTAAPSGVASLVSSCGTVQYAATVGARIVCVDASTSIISSTDAPLAPSSTTAVATADNGNGTSTETRTSTSPTGEATVTTRTFNTTTNATISETKPVDPNSADMGQFCAKNPTADICTTTTSGTGAATTGLYTSDANGKTFAGSVATFRGTIQAAPFYSATAGFLNAGAIVGACSGLATTITLWPGSNFTIDLAPYLCGPTAATFYSYLAAGMLLIATGIAFAIAIL